CVLRVGRVVRSRDDPGLIAERALLQRAAVARADDDGRPPARIGRERSAKTPADVVRIAAAEAHEELDAIAGEAGRSGGAGRVQVRLVDRGVAITGEDRR